MVKRVVTGCVAVLLLLASCHAAAPDATAPGTVATATTAAEPAESAREQQRPAVISCEFPDTPGAHELAERIMTDQTLIQATAGTVAFAVHDDQTGVGCERNGSAVFEAASIIKVSTVTALFWQAETQGLEVTEDERWLAELAITVSDNDAQQQLWESIGGAEGVAEFFAAAGMSATTPSYEDDDWGMSEVTVGDQLRLIRHLVDGTLLNRADSDFIRDLMRRVDPEQSWGISAGAPEDAEVMLKNGWLDDPLQCDDWAEFCEVTWTHNSIGHVASPTASYSMAVLSSGNPSHEEGQVLVSDVAARVAAAVLG